MGGFRCYLQQARAEREVPLVCRALLCPKRFAHGPPSLLPGGYLRRELPRRVAHGAVGVHLQFQVSFLYMPLSPPDAA